MSMRMGHIIRRHREDAKISRRQLAEAVGVTVADLSWWESAGTRPEEDVLELVASSLGTTTTVLYLESGEIPPDVDSSRLADPKLTAQIAALLDGGRVAGRSGPSVARRKAPNKPVFKSELGQLYHADCVDLMRELPSRMVDCVFADPPFNLGKDYGSAVVDSLGDDEYLGWSRRWIDEAVRILKPGGALFLYNLPRWNIHLADYLARYLTFKHWVTVDIKFSLPIAGRLYPSHYSLLYFIKGEKPRVFHPPRLPLLTCRHCGGEIRDYGGYKDRMNPNGVNLTDVWTDIPPVRHRRYKNRSANELALKLMDRVLDIATDEGDVVFDPFGGGGATFAACEMKGRRWIGSELGDCQPIIERIKNLDQERQQLAQIRSQINVLFTDTALSLRNRNGHDTSRYRVNGNGGTESATSAASGRRSKQLGIFDHGAE